jgi:hypothetical protein
MMDSDIDVLGGFSPESILGGLPPKAFGYL